MDIRTDLGRRVFGGAAIALGVLGLSFQDFATVWQPVPAEMPGYAIAAVAAAALFLVSGIALQWERASPYGAAATALLYAIFTTLWVGRILSHPQIFATWGGTAEELALVSAAVATFARYSAVQADLSARIMRGCTMVFGICTVAFGINHFFNMTFTAAMVPSWIPPGQWFWALATGLADVLAGSAIITGIFAKAAARLLTLMFMLFGLLIWLPKLFGATGAPINWTGNAVNLALIGAAWIISETIEVLATRSAVLVAPVVER